MTVSVTLRSAQTNPLSWAQVDQNFTNLANGINAPSFSGGPTSSRPTTPTLYQYYVDKTLGYPVFCISISPVIWVNAAGIAS